MVSNPKIKNQVFLFIFQKPKVAIAKLVWKIVHIMKSGLDSFPPIRSVKGYSQLFECDSIFGTSSLEGPVQPIFLYFNSKA